MDNSTFLPLTPSVDTTTPLFSRTSRSLRPRHRTTTLMFVSSPPSGSPAGLRFGVRDLEEATLSVGDARPAMSVGVAVCARLGPGRAVGGRMVDVFFTGPEGLWGTIIAALSLCCADQDALRFRMKNGRLLLSCCCFPLLCRLAAGACRRRLPHPTRARISCLSDRFAMQGTSPSPSTCTTCLLLRRSLTAIVIEQISR